MASKRTFGLVGDYGDDSSDNEEETSEEAQTQNSKEKLCQGYLVKKIKTSENDNSTNNSMPSNRTKWDGVRTEYDNSSLMYKYTQDMSDEEDQKSSTVIEQKNDLAGAQEAAAKALAKADSLIVSGNINTNKPEQSLENQSEYVQLLVADQQRRQRDAEAREQAVLNWEISEIQKEISDERRRWDGVWSDEEGDGAETEAVNKDQKRRNDVIQAVLDEVQKKNKKAEEDDKDKYTKKGERWKRLQMIAQSRVNTDPDKINQYPAHKFPLREQR